MGPPEKRRNFCEFTVIDSGHRLMCAIEVASKRNGSATHAEPGKPLVTNPGAELKQHDRWMVSYEMDASTVTTDNCVLEAKRQIWSIGSMMDSQCDVHFTNGRCWIANARMHRSIPTSQTRSACTFPR